MKKIAIIGQGYVGLPLAIEFAYHFPVLGFDIDPERIGALKNVSDRTLEADVEKLREVTALYDGKPFSRGYKASGEIEDLRDAEIYIVTVPTPVTRFNAPNLNALMKASEMLGTVLKKGDIVIYESTVYPGCTEEECVPILEKYSGLRFNEDFFVGYSPERIVPGDKINTLTTIKKVTSGSTPTVAQEIDVLYQTIITAGTHLAPNIKVAEASKAIENAQRDVNISFVNELALIFDRMGIDTNDVLDAAATKFNFLKYKPGLVGGHCISVDPYYLSHKAVQLGYHPNVILSGRRVNDSMAEFVASKAVKMMIKKKKTIDESTVLILGVTFKENCPDIRNTKVVDVYRELKEYGVEVVIYDPWANPEEVFQEYGIKSCQNINECFSGTEALEVQTFDAVIVAVAHREFLQMDVKGLLNKQGVLFDLKACLDRSIVDARL